MIHKIRIHLIANSHLDPVWLWDWREGLNEGLITCRTILDMMDEHPELTYNRGEAVIYQHIEQTDPGTFGRIKARVADGRWDVIGGTYLQSDNNLPATETLLRNLLRGQKYFRARFGSPVEAAWSADCFGHAAGLPEILASAGIKYFAFTRPSTEFGQPAFWWASPGGSRVLAYHPTWQSYYCDRHNLKETLDQTLIAGKKGKLQNIACFYGLGDHGGGPTRRHLEDIQTWAGVHPEVAVVHSTLHRFFRELEREITGKSKNFIPTHCGEMNFVLRGCYSSLAKIKFQFRQAEAVVRMAEQTDAIVSARLARRWADLSEAWDALLFNSFHDILTGTSIERAINEQMAWLNLAMHKSKRIEFDALNALAKKIDTRVAKPRNQDMPSGVAVLVWNHNPRPFKGLVEFEANLDYRPIGSYQGRPGELPVRILDARKRPLPFQLVATEHTSFSELAWRKRVLAPVTIPAMGWQVLEIAWVEGAAKPEGPKDAVAATSPKTNEIDNGFFRIKAVRGEYGIGIFNGRKPFFEGAGLGAVVFDDPWGSWGDETEGKGIDVSTVRERWKITKTAVLETGPWRASLWVRLAGKNSCVDLTLRLYAGRNAIETSARILWNERSARLKLVMPGGDQAEFEVPGARVRRGPSGEVPGGRWVRVFGKKRQFGFASDALYNFDCKSGMFRATVVRASRYADNNTRPPLTEPWRPAADRGELSFRFLLTPDLASLPQLAAELECPPTVLVVPPSAGPLPGQGSLLQINPAQINLLALKQAENGAGLILRLQNFMGKRVKPKLMLTGHNIALGVLDANRIGSWRLKKSGKGWRVVPCDTTE